MSYSRPTSAFQRHLTSTAFILDTKYVQAITEWITSCDTFITTHISPIGSMIQTQIHVSLYDIVETTLLHNITSLLPFLAHHHVNTRDMTQHLLLQLATIFDPNISQHVTTDDTTTSFEHHIHTLFLHITPALRLLAIPLIHTLESHYHHPHDIMRNISINLITCLIFIHKSIFIDDDQMICIWNILFMLDIRCGEDRGTREVCADEDDEMHVCLCAILRRMYV